MKQLSILTFNCPLLDISVLKRPIYRPVGFIEQRLQALIDNLRRQTYDIVCLQECFHSRYRQRIINELLDCYPYSSPPVTNIFRLRLGNDLLVLSRYPITKCVTKPFNNATLEERIFTQLGFLSLEIHLTDMLNLQIINYHMSAGGLFSHPEDERMNNIRQHQIEQTLQHCIEDTPVILAGDLNAGRETAKRNYYKIIDSGFTDAFELAGGEGHTWHPSNPLVMLGDESHLPEQRIDHIFVNTSTLERLNPIHASIHMNNKLPNEDRGDLTISDHYGVNVIFDIV